MNMKHIRSTLKTLLTRLVIPVAAAVSFSAQAAQDLYEIITERYEKGSLIITSNRAFEEWGEVFANDLLASAALDRLTHHSHTLVIRGDSFRQRSRRKEIAPINSSIDAPLKPEI